MFVDKVLFGVTITLLFLFISFALDKQKEEQKNQLDAVKSYSALFYKYAFDLNVASDSILNDVSKFDISNGLAHLNKEDVNKLHNSSSNIKRVLRPLFENKPDISGKVNKCLDEITSRFEELQILSDVSITDDNRSHFLAAKIAYIQSLNDFMIYTPELAVHIAAAESAYAKMKSDRPDGCVFCKLF